MKNYLLVIVAAASLVCGEAQAACSSPTGSAGDLMFNAAQHIMQFCDNTAWRGIGVAGSGSSNCSSPTGVLGAIVFNSSFSVMQYCNGTSWSPMAKVGVAPSLCTASPTTITATGSSTYNIPANCTQVTVEAFGAGGSGSPTSARGASGGGGASAVIRNTGSVLLVVGGGGGGGGGVDGGGTASRGGGGGYAVSTITVTPGEQLNTYVGSGGVKASSDTGGAGGATSPYNGGAGGNRRANGTAATYGGGGGGGAENSGANSTYGGAGGRGDNGGPACGTSTNGGACSTIQGGGGGGYSSSGGTVILGSNGLTGAAANSGPGTGNSNATGGNGKIVITPVGSTGCTSPTGVAGDLMYNSSYRLLQYCDSSAWQRVGIFQPTLLMDFAANKYSMNGTSYGSLAALLTATSGTFTRASAASYFDTSGVLQSATSGTVRFDNDPVSLESRGVLIEEARTNLVKYSAAIDNAAWYKAAGISVTANATTAPDGTTSAESVSPTAAASAYVSQSAASVWTAGQTVTRSVYAKAGVGTIAIFGSVVGGSYTNSNTYFDLSTGTVGTTATGVTALIQNVGNGWYRLIATKTWAAAADANNRFDFITVDSDGSATIGNNIYLWGAQMEIGPNVTSYIPTAGSTVTRAADVLTVPTSLWYNANMGTFFAETYGEKNNYGSTYSGYVIGVGGGTDKNLIDFSSSLSSFEAWCNGTDSAMPATFSPAASPSQSVKVAFAWNSTGTTRSLIASGGSVVTGNYGSYGCDYTAPSIRIGGDFGGATLNAPIKQIQYYPFSIPTAELQSMVQQ